MSVCPKASWGWVKALLHSVYDQPDAEAVHAQYDRVLDALADKLPEVHDHLDAARADVLAFTAFPKEIWRQIWSNRALSNCLESFGGVLGFLGEVDPHDAGWCWRRWWFAKAFGVGVVVGVLDACSLSPSVAPAAVVDLVG